MANLTSAVDVKAFAGVQGNTEDTAINTVVAGVSELMGGLIGHDFEGSAYTERLSPPVSGQLILGRPAAAITSVTVAGQALTASDYTLEGDRQIRRMASGVPTAWARTGTGSIVVVYDSSSTIPSDVELAARMAAAFVLKQSAMTAGSARLGLGAQANADTGAADYFVHQIRDLPYVRDVVKRHRSMT